MRVFFCAEEVKTRQCGRLANSHSFASLGKVQQYKKGEVHETYYCAVLCYAGKSNFCERS